MNAAGLSIAVGVASERQAERIRSRCLQRGLLLITQGSKLLLLPPLTIESAAANRGLDIIEASVA